MEIGQFKVRKQFVHKISNPYLDVYYLQRLDNDVIQSVKMVISNVIVKHFNVIVIFMTKKLLTNRKWLLIRW